MRTRSRSSFHKLAALDAAAQLNQILADPAIRPPLDLLSVPPQSEPIAGAGAQADAAAITELEPSASASAVQTPLRVPELDADAPRPVSEYPMPRQCSASVPELSPTTTPEPVPALQPECVLNSGTVPEFGTVPTVDPERRRTAVPNFSTVPNSTAVSKIETASQIGTASAHPPLPQLNSAPGFAPLPERPAEEARGISVAQILPSESREGAGPGDGQRAKLIRVATKVQDPEINSERTVYALLWDEGAVETRYEDGSPRTKISEAGLRTLATRANTPFSVCQEAIKGLTLKLDIERIEDGTPALRAGARYRVYGFKEILRRRQIAGLTFYVKRAGGGRVFVTAEGTEIDLRALHNAGAVPGFGEVSVPNFGAAVPRSGTASVPNFSGELPNSGTPSVPDFGTQQESKFLENQSKPTSSVLDLSRVAEAFLKYHSGADQPLIDATIAGVLSRVPDATADEIVAAIELKGQETQASRAAAVHPGKYLRAAVMRHFEGDVFQARRLRAKVLQDAGQARSSTRGRLPVVGL